MKYKVKSAQIKTTMCAKISSYKQIVCIMHYHLYFCRSFTDESRNYLIDFIELSCRDYIFAAWRNTRKSFTVIRNSELNRGGVKKENVRDTRKSRE